MSGMNPTYQSGFASPQRGRLKYPSLWRGCVGAWAPSLGQTGLSLRDHSMYGNHGTLTNAPTWSPSGGRTALSFDGANDYVSVSANSFTNTIGRDDFTFSFWCFLRSQGEGSLGTICDNYLSTLGGFYVLVRGVGGNTLAVQAGLSHTWDLTHISADNVFGTNRWDHFAVVFSFSELRFSLYRNGLLVDFPRVAVPSGTPVSHTRPLILGNREATDRTLDGLLDDTRLYSRGLTANEIRSLASRRGIAYELATRRRPKNIVPPFRAAWLNQRSHIIGGGVR